MRSEEVSLGLHQQEKKKGGRVSRPFFCSIDLLLLGFSETRQAAPEPNAAELGPLQRKATRRKKKKKTKNGVHCPAAIGMVQQAACRFQDRI